MRKNTKDDIWRFINKGDPNKCWEYRGSKFSKKYGRFFFGGKSVLAHRFVYELENGAIEADGMYVMHKCNNKLCCNPQHLTLGTNRDNQMHASASGAWKLGVSGIKGVGYDKKRNYWVARCFEGGKSRNLYTGPHKEKAISARKKWEDANNITFNI